MRKTRKPPRERAPVCQRDGFPKLKINDRLECVAEYLDGCLGQEQVVDVVREGKTTFYVFANGHKLPLLCACCGAPLTYDLDRARRDLTGRRLVSMALGRSELQDGRQVDSLILEFSKKGLLSRMLPVTVAFAVAAKLQHPANCPNANPALAQKRSQGEMGRG